jgi:Ran GTPase-activating protein (RanGAP) involved in mRNA processing and transport
MSTSSIHSSVVATHISIETTAMNTSHFDNVEYAPSFRETNDVDGVVIESPELRQALRNIRRPTTRPFVSNLCKRLLCVTKDHAITRMVKPLLPRHSIAHRRGVGEGWFNSELLRWLDDASAISFLLTDSFFVTNVLPRYPTKTPYTSSRLACVRGNIMCPPPAFTLVAPDESDAHVMLRVYRWTRALVHLPQGDALERYLSRLCMFPHLRELRLSRLRVSDKIAINVAGALTYLQYLEVLDLSYNELGATERGFYELAIASPNVSNLKVLDVSGNKLGLDAWRWLGEWLKVLPNLEELTLRATNLTHHACEHVASGLSSASQLRVLCLSDNGSVALEGWAVLSDALLSLNNLETLELDGTDVGAGGVERLSRGLSACSRLQVLSMRYSKIDVAGCAALASIFVHTNVLKELILHGASLDNSCISALLRGLPYLRHLAYIGLSYNSFTDVAVRELLPVLRRLPSLTKADLTDNLIKNEFEVDERVIRLI